MAKTSLWKIPDSWRTGWKAKACTSFVLYLKVLKNHLYYLWHVRVLSIKPCLHTQLPEDNKSYRKVSRGEGHLITWNGPMMGHLNSFSIGLGRGEFEQKFSKNSNARGGCWSFDLTGTLLLVCHPVCQPFSRSDFPLFITTFICWVKQMKQELISWAHSSLLISIFEISKTG